MRPVEAALVVAALFGLVGDGRANDKTASVEGSMVMRGIDLYMHDSAPTFGDTRNPTFWVHAESGNLSPDASLWELHIARAVIYRDNEDDLHIEADSGQFDQANQLAYLHDGVKATSGRLVVEIQDLEWDNKARIARSESAAEIRDGTNELSGRPVRIYPREDRMELGAGSGTIRLSQSVASDASSPNAEAESEAGRYRAIDIKWQGKVTGNLNGRLSRISDGVHLVVIGASDADTIDIKAGSVEFEYEGEDSKMPSKMLFDTDAVFDLQDGTIRADEVVLDLAADTAEFRGNLNVDFERLSGARPEFLRIDLETQEFVGGPGPLGTYRISDDVDTESNDDP